MLFIVGARKGIKDLTDIVVDFMSDKRGVDWRLAYRELAVITDGANGPKEQPADVRLQCTSPITRSNDCL